MVRVFHQRVVRLLDHEYSAAFSIGLGVVSALVWSGAGNGSYEAVVNGTWSDQILHQSGIDSLHSLVANGLMTIFFFAIGLELSRELRNGSLANRSVALPPVLGAVGGMVATAVLSIGIGSITHTPALRHGWGIPMATDIAFTLGALALVGRGLPQSLRLFLLTLAIADDVFSVTVLTFTGSTHVRVAGLGAIVFVVMIGAVVLRRQRGTAWRLVLLGALWLCFVWANIEAPLAGLVAGLLISSDEGVVGLERQVSRWSVALVLPLFALVACGIQWSHISLHGATLTVIAATVGTRLVGKVVGIVGGVALARLFGWQLPPSISWSLLATAALLCAIGLTVPLLFAGALFDVKSATYGAFTLGLLLSSVFATALGIPLLKLQARRS